MISIQQIMITTNNGQKAISALCFGDKWAIHQAPVDPSDLWYVTHIQTGLYLVSEISFFMALEIVQAIQDYDYPEHITEIEQVIGGYNLELES